MCSIFCINFSIASTQEGIHELAATHFFSAQPVRDIRHDESPATHRPVAIESASNSTPGTKTPRIRNSGGMHPCFMNFVPGDPYTHENPGGYRSIRSETSAPIAKRTDRRMFSRCSAYVGFRPSNPLCE